MEFTEPAMRPPQEARSLLLRATQGCSYNKCDFCYVSRGYKFMAVSPEELAEEARSMKARFPPNTRVYLTGSNPFVLPTLLLKEYIAALRGVFPDFERMSMQTRIGDLKHKSDAELRELRELGVKHLYIGVENGDEETLKMMNKGHAVADVIRELKRLDDAGITYTCFYVLGLGGKGAGKRCGAATAAMFNQVNPVRITTTGMTVFDGAPLAERAARGEFIEASEKEKIEELGEFLTNLKIDVFYDGVHYLNPVNYRFRNSDALVKAEVLKDIRDILDNCPEEDLEATVNRKAMKSL